MASRTEQMVARLRDLQAGTADIEASAVVSVDGLIMASSLPADVEEDRVSAMSAAMLSLGERIASELGRGILDQVYIRGDNGYVILMSIGEEAVLTALARGDVHAALHGEVRRHREAPGDGGRQESERGAQERVRTSPAGDIHRGHSRLAGGDDEQPVRLRAAAVLRLLPGLGRRGVRHTRERGRGEGGRGALTGALLGERRVRRLARADEATQRLAEGARQSGAMHRLAHPPLSFSPAASRMWSRCPDVTLPGRNGRQSGAH